ncbi:MAG: EFR1 family ferrodoxin [Raoultibacter sp.]
MILCFSGTGNSLHAAKIIQRITGDEILSLNARIKHGDHGVISSERPLVFVCPIYAGRIPRIVERAIAATSFRGNNQAYFVATCFADPSHAQHYVEKLCRKKGFALRGFNSVDMPQSYLVRYPTLEKPQAAHVIKIAEPKIERIAAQIAQGTPLEAARADNHRMSTLGNRLFYPFLVSAKGFYATEACTSCGLCQQVCPLNNIHLKNGRPLWSNTCTHCMACIARCPEEAIEFKHKTQGKARHYLEE